MTPDRWKRLSGLFAQAVVLQPSERARFLDRVCAGAPDDRRDLEELLAAASSPVAVGLESPPAMSSAHVDGIASWVGRTVGNYEVVRELGHGGMGVVYLATDTRLNRQVALKALPASLAADPQRRARLRKEAVAAAGLSHSGIAAVHALEEIGDDLFIVSEYVEGRSLRQLILDGPMRLSQVIGVNAAVADALAFAHARGVVHRDLKPDNVLLPASGGVKVVDFGLARVLGPGSSDALTAATLTRSGMLLGTPAYMAPEQIRGGPVDARADVFALGVTIYECATGANPFAAQTAEASMARVLEHELDLSGLQTRGAGVLLPIVRRATAKDPAERYASAREVAAALDAVTGASSGAPFPLPGRGPAPASLVTTSWRAHQVIVSIVVLLMLWPLSAVRGLVPGATRTFLVALAAAVLIIAVRLNRTFLSYVDVATLLEQQRRLRRVLTFAEVAFCAALGTAAVLAADTHLGFASLFAAAALGLAAGSWIIEPSTTKTAFPE